MTDSDPLPLLPDSDCSPVPVFNCQIILRRSETGDHVQGRVANLSGITAKGATERDVLMQITKRFRQTVQEQTAAGQTIPWIDPPELPGPGEVERFVPVHL